MRNAGRWYIYGEPGIYRGKSAAMAGRGYRTREQAESRMAAILSANPGMHLAVGEVPRKGSHAAAPDAP